MIRKKSILLLATLVLASEAASESSDMEYIFFAGGSMHNPSKWANAMVLRNSWLDVSFRIGAVPSPDHNEIDNYVSEMETRGYDYYVTAASSDYANTDANAGLYWDYQTMAAILSNNPHAKGLYLHEIKTWSYERSVALNWTMLEQYFACARQYNKKVLWNEWGWGWWLIRNDAGYDSAFSEYGDVVVPVWANNDPCNWEWARDDATAASNQYCDGKSGASIQDWYWYELGYNRHDMPADVVTDFIEENCNNGGMWSQFEYEWDDPEFFHGIATYGRVNLYDFAPFVAEWLAKPCDEPDWCGGADINSSGAVDFADFAIFADNWLAGI